MSLFHHDHPPRCAYCAVGRKLSDEEVYCVKRGVVSAGHHCRSFRYDPLKRIPPRRPALPKNFTADDFSID